MNCTKCGAELHPDQKVCIQCGTRTAAGGQFEVEQPKEPWRPTKNMIIGAGAAVVLLIIILVVLSQCTTPPEAVADEWFSAMSQRSMRKARHYLTPELQQRLGGGGGELMAMADEYYTAVLHEDATYTVGKPTYNAPKKPTRANVVIVISYPGGTTGQVEIQLTKVGRRWLISQIVMSAV